MGIYPRLGYVTHHCTPGHTRRVVRHAEVPWSFCGRLFLVGVFWLDGGQQVARLLESKGVGNVTPEELMGELANFGLEGEEAEDVLLQAQSPSF